MGNPLRELVNQSRKDPKLRSNIEEGIEHFGSDPVPGIMASVIADPGSDGNLMCSIWLAYIGHAAIPHLVHALGHPDGRVAMFAGKTLAAIEGGSRHLLQALESRNPEIRYHADGALQGCAEELRDALPRLCEFMSKEAAASDGSGDDTPWRVARNLAGVIHRMGTNAIRPMEKLLSSPNWKVRFSAVSALGAWKQDDEGGRKPIKEALPVLRSARAKEKHELLRKAMDLAIGELSGC